MGFEKVTNVVIRKYTEGQTRNFPEIGLFISEHYKKFLVLNALKQHFITTSCSTVSRVWPQAIYKNTCTDINKNAISSRINVKRIFEIKDTTKQLKTNKRF